MSSDTAFGDSVLEEQQTQQASRSDAIIRNIGGSDMVYDAATWKIIDIRSQTEVTTESRGGGGTVQGYGGFVSGHISPVKVTTTTTNYFTYYLENDHGRRMHFTLVNREIDVIVGDNLYVVTAAKAEKAKGFHIPMVYIPAYDKWDIFKEETSAMVWQSKLGKILGIITMVMALLFGAFGYLAAIASGSGSTMSGAYYLILGPGAALLAFAIFYMIFHGISWLILQPVKMTLKGQLKKLQKELH